MLELVHAVTVATVPMKSRGYIITAENYKEFDNYSVDHSFVLALEICPECAGQARIHH